MREYLGFLVLFLSVCQGFAHTPPPLQGSVKTVLPQDVSEELLKNLKFNKKKFNDLVDPAKKKKIERLQQQLRDGGWIGSGGGGLQCGSQMMLLDYWENQNEVSGFVEPYDHETPLSYLERILTTHLTPYSPFLAFRIRQAVEMITKNSWVRMESLPVLPDTGEIRRKIPAPCERVQFIIRLARSSGENQPQPLILLNQSAYQKLQTQDHRMAVLQEAFLILHEAIYTYGVHLDQSDSAQTRILTALLLSSDLYSILQKQPPGQSFISLFAAVAATQFKDLFTIFFRDDKSVLTNVNLSAKDLQRIRIFGDLIKKVTALAIEVVGYPAKKNVTDRDRARIAQKIEYYYANIASDEACLLAASIKVSEIGIIPTPDSLVIPGHLEYDQRACFYMRTMKYASPIIAKAARYCQQQGMIEN